jgi:multiple sugar transport system substrate-binding protein
MQRRSLPLALLFLIPLVATACGPGSNASGGPGVGGSGGPEGSGTAAESPGGSTSAADLSGSLTIGAKLGCKPAPCTPTGDGAADEIAYTRYNTFATQYPNVSMTFTESDFDAQQFLTAVAAGKAPDVIRMDRAIMGTYIAQGALQPLDDCIAKFGVDMSQFRQPAVAAVTMDGQVYGIPEFYDSRIILVNDSVVQDAKLTTADIDTSDWDKLAQVNQKLLKKNGDKIARIGFDPKLPEFLPLWAKANGASIISDDGLTSQLDDPKVAEALKFAASLITAHGSGPAFFDFRGNGPGGVDFFGPKNQFVEDTLGAMPMEEWYLNVLANNSPNEKISFAPFKDRQGNNISFSGGSAWAIPAGAKNPDAACEFMRVITLPDTWYAAAKVRADKRKADGEAFTGVYTGNTVADQKIFGDLVTQQTAGNYWDGVQLVLSTSDVAFSLPPTPAAEEFTTIWQNAVNNVINKGADPTQALAQADKEAQDAIDAAKQ